MAPLSKPEANKLKEEFLISLVKFLDISHALGEGAERDTYISEYRTALGLSSSPAPPLSLSLSGGRRMKRRSRASRKLKFRARKQSKRNRRR